MSDHDDTRRADVIRGLRELADFIEATPDVPAPSFALVCKSFRFYNEADTLAGFIAAARALGEAQIDGTSVKVKREFAGGVAYEADAWAADVCEEREVTSTALVLPTELVPPEPVSELGEPARELDEADKAKVGW